MAYQFISTPDEHAFEAYMSEHGVALQSMHWAAVKSNWQRRLFALEDSHHSIVAAAMVLVKPLPLGYSMYYIPRGPIADGQDQDLMIELLNHIKNASRQDKCIFIKFDPYILDNKKEQPFTMEEDHDFARHTAEQSMVLLKNEDVLPLKADEKVAFIGGFAKKPRFQGGGSSHINSFRVSSAMDAVSRMEGISGNVTYAEGFAADRDVYDEATERTGASASWYGRE